MKKIFYDHGFVASQLARDLFLSCPVPIQKGQSKNYYNHFFESWAMYGLKKP